MQFSQKCAREYRPSLSFLTLMTFVVSPVSLNLTEIQRISTLLVELHLDEVLESLVVG